MFIQPWMEDDEDFDPDWKDDIDFVPGLGWVEGNRVMYPVDEDENEMD